MLTKAWATKTAVLVCIDKAKGGNDFKLPHSKDMEDFDWDEMFEGWEKEDTDSDEEAESSDDSEDE